ncbi:MAG: hypothetical protein FLDDKLPJ_02861 [Phycisphaerae bacterium]|nr:hypothetical protein [Phycisphaerae bacterium]
MAKKAGNGKSGGRKSRTKSEVYSGLAEKAGVTKKQIAAVFDEIGVMIKRDLGKSGPGQFVIPGLVKVRVVRKPATKAREGINPFTGEKQLFKAKPARNVVKASAVKALKDLV